MHGQQNIKKMKLLNNHCYGEQTPFLERRIFCKSTFDVWAIYYYIAEMYQFLSLIISYAY